MNYADEITRRAIKRDAEQAEREAINCEQCRGIEKCPNSLPGYCAVIMPYPDYTRMPHLVVRECRFETERKQVLRDAAKTAERQG